MAFEIYLPEKRVAASRGLWLERLPVDFLDDTRRDRPSHTAFVGWNSELAREIRRVRCQIGESTLHVGCCSHRTQCVVLADLRHPEHGHDAVAHQLDDRAPMGVDGAPHRRVVAVHEMARRFGVEADSEPFEAGR